MNLMVGDFETYYCKKSGYSIRQMTTESYVRDPRFQLIMFTYKINGGRTCFIHGDHFKHWINDFDWENTIFGAQHAHFEGLILSHHFNVRPAMFVDSLSMSRLLNGPKARHDLGALAKREGLQAKGDEVEMANGKHIEDFNLDEFNAYKKYCMGDTDITHEVIDRYMQRMPLIALRLIDIKIKMFTDPVFQGDTVGMQDCITEELRRKKEMLLKTGHQCPTCGGAGCITVGVNPETEAPDQEECKKCKGTGTHRALFASKPKFKALLESHGVEVPLKLSPAGLKRQPPEEIWVPAFAKTDPGMQELLEHEDETVRILAEARVSVASNITQTRSESFLGMAQRGLMPVYIKPFGQHTMRGSAGDGSNFMNLTSNGDETRKKLTRTIEAPPGCVIVSRDSSQIQARLTSWLFGQEDKLELFRAGRDVYSEFASLVYNRPVDRKKVKGDYIPGQVGKISELGFGFQQGWEKSAFNFLKGHLGAPPIQFTEQDMANMEINPGRWYNNPRWIEKVEKIPSRLDFNAKMVHCAVTNGIVDMWRARNPAIVAGWDLMEKAINAMIAGEEMVFGPNGCLRTEKDALVLPSGLRILYRDIRRTYNEDKRRWEASYWNERNRENIYGGAATNNGIQGLEQEIMGAAAVEIADRGYKIASECYDAIVCVVPKAQGERCLEDMGTAMLRGLAWTTGLPLASEGGIGTNFLEAK